MLVNCVDFYLLNHLVNMIKNIPYVFVPVMVFDKIYGHHLSERFNIKNIYEFYAATESNAYFCNEI